MLFPVDANGDDTAGLDLPATQDNAVVNHAVQANLLWENLWRCGFPVRLTLPALKRGLSG